MNKERLIELLKEEEIKLALIEILKDEFCLKEKIEDSSREDVVTEGIKNNLTDNEGENNLETLLLEERRKVEEMRKIIDKLKKLLGLTEDKNKELESSIVIKDAELKVLEKEKARLKSEIDSIRKQREDELEALNRQRVLIQKELEEKKSKIAEVENKNVNLSNRVNFYRDSFQEDLKVYEIYTQLSDSTKSSLKGIFKDDSLKGFLACGIQDRNINSLWEYIKDEIREGQNEDIPKLKEVFTFLFARYQMAYPIFELQKVEVGNTFDEFNHIRHSDSKEVSGSISEVSFLGWINIKTNKVVKKSIVKMG